MKTVIVISMLSIISYGIDIYGKNYLGETFLETNFPVGEDGTQSYIS